MILFNGEHCVKRIISAKRKRKLQKRGTHCQWSPEDNSYIWYKPAASFGSDSIAKYLGLSKAFARKQLFKVELRTASASDVAELRQKILGDVLEGSYVQKHDKQPELYPYQQAAIDLMRAQGVPPDLLSNEPDIGKTKHRRSTNSQQQSHSASEWLHAVGSILGSSGFSHMFSDPAFYANGPAPDDPDIIEGEVVQPTLALPNNGEK